MLASFVAAAGAASSCSSDGDGMVLEPFDAGPDTSTDDAAPLDTPPDAALSRDASLFDGGPLPVVCVKPPCATSIVTTLAVDSSHPAEGFCALLHDGTVACWGANGVGQLGRGDESGAIDSATSARVVGLSDVAKLDHTCALDKRGGVWCWGKGPYLQSDAGATTAERTPVKLPIPPAKNIGMSWEIGCAGLDDGILCWGKNSFGQVARFESSPAHAVLLPQAIPIPSGAPIRDVVVGNASFAMREDGETVSWGANPPLGRISPFFPDSHPMPIALHGITSMDVTGDSACATAFGIGYCWGTVIPKSSDSVPSNAPRIDRALPAPVSTPEPIVQIATTPTMTSYDFGDPILQPQRWCAVGASGDVYCWGDNAGGQAGDGTKNYAFDAVRVQGLPVPAAQVKTTPNATCALLTNGRVYCWGTNYYGQLGNGMLKEPSLVPQEVVLP